MYQQGKYQILILPLNKYQNLKSKSIYQNLAFQDRPNIATLKWISNIKISKEPVSRIKIYPFGTPYCVNTQNNIWSEELIWFNGDCSTTKWFSTFQDLYVFRCFSCPAGGVILKICLSLGGSYLEFVGCRGGHKSNSKYSEKNTGPPGT